MTFEELQQIPDLQIEVDDLTEQCFYVKMAILGRIDKYGVACADWA